MPQPWTTLIVNIPLSYK